MSGELHGSPRTRGIIERIEHAYATIEDAWRQLEAFTGEGFLPELVDFARCCEFVEREAALLSDAFYGSSVGYLYELTHFHFMPYKEPALDMILALAHEMGVTDVADVGCGVGLDAQALANQGLHVTGYDLESPCLAYAQSRTRGYPRHLLAFEPLRAVPQRQHDIVYALDVVEHVAKPEAFIETLFLSGRFVCFNLFRHETTPHPESDLHFALNHRSLLPLAQCLGTLSEVAVAGDTVALLWERRERD